MKKIIFLFLISFVFIVNISALSNQEEEEYNQTKSGSISLTKIDSERINRKEATLEGAIYGIYNKNNELISTLTTDINGEAYIDNIPYGMYFLREITPSMGYKLNSALHTLTINDSFPDWYVYSSEEVIKGKLIINKYYVEENNYQLEDDTEFEIYDIDNELVGNYKIEQGRLEVILPYGTYKVVQITGIEGYELVDSFDVKIQEKKDYIYDLYSKKIKDEIKDEFINNDVPKIDMEEFVPEINEEEKEETKTEPKEEIEYEETKDVNLEIKEEKKEDIIIVEVPDTYKFNYNKIIIFLFIVLGFVFVLIGIKKLRND